MNQKDSLDKRVDLPEKFVLTDEFKDIFNQMEADSVTLRIHDCHLLLENHELFWHEHLVTFGQSYQFQDLLNYHFHLLFFLNLFFLINIPQEFIIKIKSAQILNSYHFLSHSIFGNQICVCKLL